MKLKAIEKRLQMDEKKQIEELSGFLYHVDGTTYRGGPIRVVNYDALARALYDEGYRKQSEGEWVGTHNLRHCSKCGNVVNFNNVSSWLYNFCPNCGKKMKGV